MGIRLSPALLGLEVVIVKSLQHRTDLPGPDPGSSQPTLAFFSPQPMAGKSLHCFLLVR